MSLYSLPWWVSKGIVGTGEVTVASSVSAVTSDSRRTSLSLEPVSCSGRRVSEDWREHTHTHRVAVSQVENVYKRVAQEFWHNLRKYFHRRRRRRRRRHRSSLHFCALWKGNNKSINTRSRHDVICGHLRRVSYPPAAVSSDPPGPPCAGLPGTVVGCPQWKHFPGGAESLCSGRSTSSGPQYPSGQLRFKKKTVGLYRLFSYGLSDAFQPS